MTFFKTQMFVLFFMGITAYSQQFSYPGCTDVTTNDFEMVSLVQKLKTSTSGMEPLYTKSGIAVDNSINQPIQMDFSAVMSGDSVTHVNIYFVEKNGKLKFYDGVQKTVSVIGTVNTKTGTDRGLTGIALDPNFKTNKFIYFWYAPTTAGGDRMALSRFVIDNQNKLDLTSEKILFQAPLNGSGPHQGGPMKFDSQGNLYVVLGNDSPDHDAKNFSHVSQTNKKTSDEWGASGTANMRGSILRIKPDASKPSGYTIPTDNFGEYWAKYFEQKGNTTLAAEYRNPAKVLPEIFTKGHRSNFSVDADPTSNLVSWGEIGPWKVKDPNAANQGGDNYTEEFNLVRHPVFAGYPYFTGNNITTGGHTVDPLNPINNSPFNTGVKNLPPASLPLHVYGTPKGDQIGAITGPIYRYDPTLKSALKMPPHFDGKWFVTDLIEHWILALSLNTDASAVTRVDTIFSQFNPHAPLDFHLGPDGALYILNYGTSYAKVPAAIRNPGIVRFEYKGPQCNAVSIAGKSNFLSKVAFSAQSLNIAEKGEHIIKVYTLSGKLLNNFSGRGKQVYSLQKLSTFSKGILIVKVKTLKGESIGKMGRF